MKLPVSSVGCIAAFGCSGDFTRAFGLEVSPSRLAERLDYRAELWLELGE